METFNLANIDSIINDGNVVNELVLDGVTIWKRELVLVEQGYFEDYTISAATTKNTAWSTSGTTAFSTSASTAWSTSRSTAYDTTSTTSWSTASAGSHTTARWTARSGGSSFSYSSLGRNFRFDPCCHNGKWTNWTTSGHSTAWHTHVGCNAGGHGTDGTVCYRTTTRATSKGGSVTTSRSTSTSASRNTSVSTSINTSWSTQLSTNKSTTISTSVAAVIGQRWVDTSYYEWQVTYVAGQ